MTKTVLALGSLLPDEMEDLESAFEVIRLWRESDPEETLHARSQDIVAILSTYSCKGVSRRLIEALPNLEIIAQFGAGLDNIDLEAASAHEISVFNTADILSADTADTAMALIISLARRIVEADMFVRVGKWSGGPFPLGTSLGGKVVGIVGMGRIGREIAKRCAAFNMQVVYHGPNEKTDLPYDYYPDLPAMAGVCDFLVLSCKGGEDTRDLISYDILKKLGKNGCIINVARGSIVVEEDLMIALRNRDIAGAGLDVYPDEPHVPEPLKSMDNVVLLPHIGSATVETRKAMGRELIKKLEAYFAGESLPDDIK